MSEACIGCKSLRYNQSYIPYCVSICTLRCVTIPRCPCMNCLIKGMCGIGCEEFEIAAAAYEKSVRTHLKNEHAGGVIKRKAVA